MIYERPVTNSIAAQACNALMSVVSEIKAIGVQAGQAISGAMDSISTAFKDVSLQDVSLASGPSMPRGPDDLGIS